MITTILSWVAMPIVRYAGIALIGLIFTAWMRVDAARPWQNQVAQLQEDIARRDQIIADHNKQAELDRVEAEQLDKAIEDFTHAAVAKNSACILTSAQLAELRRLAGLN